MNANKQQRSKFIKDVIELIENYGGEKIEPRVEGHIAYELSGKNGVCILTMHGENDLKNIYSIFGRFSYLNDLTGRMNYKYNFHSMENDFEDYIGKIVDELER